MVCLNIKAFCPGRDCSKTIMIGKYDWIDLNSCVFNRYTDKLREHVINIRPVAR